MLRFNKFITRPSPSLFLKLGKAKNNQSKSFRRDFVRAMSNDTYKYDGDVKHDDKDTVTIRQFFDEHGPLGVESYGDVCLIETEPVISQVNEN